MCEFNLKRTLRIIPSLGWMACIIYLSMQSGSESGELTKQFLGFLEKNGINLSLAFGEYAPVFIRKSAHFSEYFLLSLLILIATLNLKRKWSLTMVAGMVFSVADECIQSIVPGRVASIGDVVLDSMGLAFGITCFWLIRNLHAKAKRELKPDAAKIKCLSL